MLDFFFILNYTLILYSNFPTKLKKKRKKQVILESR